MKKILIGTLLLVIVVLLLLPVILINIDLNNHKAIISEKVQQITGYRLTLAGDIQHTLYPWLSIATEDITIDKAKHPSALPLLSIERLKMRLKLLPLLRKKIEIDMLQLQGVRLQLIEKTPVQAAHNTALATGSNVQEPTTTETAKAVQPPPPPPPAKDSGLSWEKKMQKMQLPIRGLALGGVDIKDVTIRWKEQGQNRQLMLDEGYLRIDTLAYGQPIKLDATVKMALNQPEISGKIKIDGLIQYSDTGSHIAITPLTISMGNDTLPADAHPTVIKTALDLDLEEGTVTLPEFHAHLHAINSTINGKMQLVQRDNAPALLATLALSSEDIAQPLSLAGLTAVTAHLAELPNRTLTINTTLDATAAEKTIIVAPFKLSLAGTDIDITAHIKNGGQGMPAINGTLAASTTDLPLLIRIAAALKGNNDMQLTLADNTALNKIRLKKTVFSGTSKQFFKVDSFEAKIDDSLIKGSFSITDFKRPAYRFALDIDRLDIDRYMPATAKQDRRVQDRKALPPEAVLAGAATELPTKTLRDLDTKGELKIGQLSFSGIKAKNAKLYIDAQNGLIKLDPVAAQLYSGHYRAKSLLDVQKEKAHLTIDTKLKDIALGALLADLLGYDSLTGKGELSLSVKTQGNDIDRLKNSLSGQGEIKLLEGSIKGIDIDKIIREAKRLKKGGGLGKEEKTSVTSLTGTAAIANGQINMDDLLMETAGLVSINGSGMLLDLNDETWDYAFTIKTDNDFYLFVDCDGKIVQKKCRLNKTETAKKNIKNTLKLDKIKIKIPAGLIK